MSSSSPSSEQSSTPQSASKKNERPQSADKMKTKHAKSPKAGGKGLRNIFKNKKAKENGVVPVKPSCFDDDFVRRPESPDTPLTSSKVKGKDEPRPYGLWRSKVGCFVHHINLYTALYRTACGSACQLVPAAVSCEVTSLAEVSWVDVRVQRVLMKASNELLVCAVI